jgi:hypothetical protein
LVDAIGGWSLARVSAALAASRWAIGLEGAEPTGAGVLEHRPELAGAPVSLLARAAWALAGHPDLRLSAGQRSQLEVAAGQLTRAGYGRTRPGPAAAAAAVIDLAFGDWVGFWQVGKVDRGYHRRDGRAPVTPGALAICAGRLAHQELAGYRQRRDPGRHERAAAHRSTRRRPQKPTDVVVADE